VDPSAAPREDRPTLVELVRLDMRRYGPRLVRAEFAGGALLAAAPALAALTAVVARPQMAPAGRLLLLALGACCAGWLLNALTLLAIACRHEPGPPAREAPGRTHRALQRLAGRALLPGCLPLLALRQGRRARRRRV